jgi:mono/diheme cytochrome c family protein
MKEFTLSAVILIGVCALPAMAADPANGRALHDPNCIACHEALMEGNADALYTRPDRLVGNFDALVKQVNRCQLTLGLQWFDEDISDVAHYLNQTYYKF